MCKQTGRLKLPGKGDEISRRKLGELVRGGHPRIEWLLGVVPKAECGN